MTKIHRLNARRETTFGRTLASMSQARPVLARSTASGKRGLMSAGLAGLAVFAAPVAEALASVCYQLPFPNPNLADGWGSLCCGRTSPHRGVDFPQGSGTPIPAVAAGTVVINGWSNCLGNVVVVQHADGMFSGYSHMVVPSPLPPGTAVAIGQQVGQVGASGSCANGAHLHLTMSDHATGYGSGTTVDPYAYITQHLTCNDPPIGNLDDADCTSIGGWTQDPTLPDATIAAHIYYNGPAGDPNAISVPITAGVYRDDLCMSINSCSHGYRVPTPLSLLDNAPHDVYVYGIDAEGSGNNPLLAGSPKTLTCPPPVLDGVRRRVPDDGVFAAWQFSAFADLVTLDDAAVLALEQTIVLPPVPELAIADDGTSDLWLIDGVAGERRRHISGPDVVAAWRLDVGVVTVWPVAKLAALAEAPPLRPRPILVKGSGFDIYVLDDRIDPVEVGSEGGEADTGGGSNEGGDTPTTDLTTSSDPAPETTAGSSEGSVTAGEATGDEGCGCRSDTRSSGHAWLGALVLLLVRPRRRR